MCLPVRLAGRPKSTTGDDRSVGIDLLDAQRLEKLRRLPTSYSRATSEPTTPPEGYHRLRREQQLSTNFDPAAEILLSWQIHSRAGLHVEASSREVGLGEVVVLTLGFRRMGVRAPCRVVEVVDEQDRRGFVYCTLPGHPESGEESFIIERRADGTTWFTIEAVSRPATRLAKLGGPLTRRIQAVMTARYLRAAG